MVIWGKFSISNNRALDKPHWLGYCHCAKLLIGNMKAYESIKLISKPRRELYSEGSNIVMVVDKPFITIL